MEKVVALADITLTARQSHKQKEASGKAKSS
jgi:hypothetical protein